jgi:RpiR family transcriptional regulator, carbohydrate utilization regulator
VVRTQPSLTDGGFLARAQAALPQLGATDRRVIQTILDDPELAVQSSVTELAARAGTAQSSAVRTCQRLGYRGFQDVKLALARDLASQEHQLSHGDGIDAQTPLSDLLEGILRRSGRALADAAQTIDRAAFELAVERIAAASRILVIGNGTSAAPAQDAAYRFSSLGLIASAPGDAIAQHLAARQLNPACACVVISHTGVTRETLVSAEAAAKAGATLIAVTSFLRSPLTGIADAALVAGGPEHGFRLEAMSSRLAHLGVIDALFVAVAVRRPEIAASALDLMADVTVEHSL